MDDEEAVNEVFDFNGASLHKDDAVFGGECEAKDKNERLCREEEEDAATAAAAGDPSKEEEEPPSAIGGESPDQVKNVHSFHGSAASNGDVPMEKNEGKRERPSKNRPYKNRRTEGDPPKERQQHHQPASLFGGFACSAESPFLPGPATTVPLQSPFLPFSLPAANAFIQPRPEFPCKDGEEGHYYLEGTGMVFTMPSCNDVVLGLSRDNCTLPGNVRFLELCRRAQKFYLLNKNNVAEQVMWTIQSLKPPGRFLERVKTEDGSVQYKQTRKDLVLE
jgi:hypothetical protein